MRRFFLTIFLCLLLSCEKNEYSINEQNLTKPYVRVEYVDKSAYEDNKEIRNKLKLFEKKIIL